MGAFSCAWTVRRMGVAQLCGFLIIANLGGTCEGPALPVPSPTGNDAIDPASTDSTDSNVDDDPTDNQVAGSTPTLPIGQVRAQPTGMTAAAVAAHQIDLTWKDNSADEEGFLLQRYSADSGWTDHATLAADTVTYSDTDIAVETNYCYRVLAFKGAERTAPSPLACTKTALFDGTGNPANPATTGSVPQGAPTALTTTLSEANGVLLNWQDNCSNEEGFRIRRFVPGGDWTDYATVAANSTSYVDTSVVAGTSYCYRVLAFKGSAQTGATGVACASPVTDGTEPDPGTNPSILPDGIPSNVVVTAVGPDQIQIQWQDNSSNEDGFRITRYTANDGWVDLAETAAGVTQYTDQGLQAKTSYCYRIAAFNGNGTTTSTTLKCAATPEAPATPGDEPTTDTTTDDGACYVNCASPAPYRAFPSAEGFGAQTQGGRGGRILQVTTLADYDTDTNPPEAVIPGSLRWALQAQTGPRIIVFTVGGTISLKGTLDLVGEAGSYVTIAGQTAPGDGIQLGGWGILIKSGAHDIIIRHLRVRPTMPSTIINDPCYVGFQKKALQIYGKANVGDSHDIILDHCSFEWGLDSSVGIRDARRVTMQWCIIGEGSVYGDALPAGVYAGNPALARPGTPSQGMTVDSQTRYDDFLTVHHSLFIHNSHRNMGMGSNGCVVEFINNFVYNHNAGAFASQVKGIKETTRLNFIGNSYLSGPSRPEKWHQRPLALTEYNDVEHNENDTPTSHCFYVQDNLDNYFRTRTSDPEWAVAAWVHWPGYDTPPVPPYVSSYFFNPLPELYRTTSPFAGAAVPVTVHAASTLESRLAPAVGATLPRRDSVDNRLINEWHTRTGAQGIGGNQQEPAWDVNGKLIRSGCDPLPTLSSGTPPADTDRDGMSDDWEIAQGLNPNSAADAKADPDSDGYTNIEEYLNYLAGEE